MAAVRENELLLLKADGTPVRTLAVLSPSGAPPPFDATVSGNEDEVVYSSIPAPPGSQIPTPTVNVVSRQGSPRGQLPAGYLAVIPPSGGKVAYVRRDPFSSRPQLVVRDFGTGEERVLPASRENFGNPAPISSLSWSNDGTKLAVALPEKIVILDVRTAVNYDSGIDLSAGTPPNHWRSAPAFMPDGKVAVVQACCRGGASGSEFQTSSIVVVDPANGAVVRTISPVQENSHRSDLSVSPDGRFFAWVSGSALTVSEDGGPAQTLGDGYVAVRHLPGLPGATNESG